MIILGYTHKGHGFKRRFSREIIRLGQLQYSYRTVTHTEMVLEGTWYNSTIASSSLMDGGVRTKVNEALNPNHWIAVDVPGWDPLVSAEWFQDYDGTKYDTRGALGSVLYGLGDNQGFFCNEACGASIGQIDPQSMPPAGFIAYCLGQPGARLVTDEFFTRGA